MKNKTFSLYAIIGVIISGLVILFISARPDKLEIPQQYHQNQISVPENYAAASISKGTILLLLAAGLIGVLGIGRRKKNSERRPENNETTQATEGHDMNEKKQKRISKNN
jgi:hypothetical protein